MYRNLIYLLLLLTLLTSCSSDNKKNNSESGKESKKNYVVIGVSNDAETLNPLYVYNVTEGNIEELMFLNLVGREWNFTKGNIEYSPMLAKEWEWSPNKESIIITLRDDIYWSDGVKITSEDVVFSFDILSDPVVESFVFGYFEKYFTDKNEKIDISKSFKILSKNKFQINFIPNSNPSLDNIDYPILPKHFFEKFRRDSLSKENLGNSLVVSGPYKIEEWRRGEAITLVRNATSILKNDRMAERFVFKILPEYQLRINQLKNGEIDLMEDIKTDDIATLKGNKKINVVPVGGRDFDYIGWNNIDGKMYNETGVIRPNKLFGSSKTRRALTLALNKKIVVEEYLSGYGQLAVSPVSKIFKEFYNSEITPLYYNPQKAISLLEAEGWKDSNGNGIIDKDGIEFEFTLHIPSGNPRREFAASVFQNNLKAVGINMSIESNEISTFIDNLFRKKYEAWMAAWIIPIPINLEISWKSDLANTPLNFPSFRNRELDLLLNKLQMAGYDEKKRIYMRIQEILHDEQPYSFLYWIDNIVAYNKRIKKFVPTPLGSINHCWNWEL